MVWGVKQSGNTSALGEDETVAERPQGSRVCLPLLLLPFPTSGKVTLGSDLGREHG